jgi:hypothetical protein
VFRSSLIALLAACSCEDADPVEPAPPHPDEEAEHELVEPPARLVFFASLGGGGEWLEDTRQIAAGPLRLLWPVRPGEILDRFAPRLGAGEHVPSDAPVFLAGLEGERGSRIAFAARTDLEDESAGEALCPDEARECAGVFGAMIVVAEDRATRDELGPFLAYGAHAREAPRPGLTLEVTPAGVATFRTDLESLVDNAARGLVRSAEREREAHPEPPALGDPEAVVRAVERRANALLDRLGSVERARVRVERVEEELALTIDLETEGALDAEIRAMSERDLEVLAAALPESTALAFATTASFEPIAADLLSVAGDRLSGPERERVRAFIEAHESAIADDGRALFAVADGSFVLAADRAGEPPLIAGTIELARAAYVRTVGEALFDCAPAPARAGETVRLCRGAETPVLHGVDGERSFARWIVTRPAGPGGAALADALERPEGEARAIAMLRVEAARALALGATAAREGETEYALGEPAPITFFVRRTEQGLRAETRCDRRTLAALVTVLAPLAGMD